MTHDSRLTQALRVLLHSRRVASLGTVGDDGTAFVSMVPFALEPMQGAFIIHVSGLAVHTRNLLARPSVSLMVMESEVTGEPVHALARVTLEGMESGSEAWQASHDAYLARFPEAEPMTQLGDFVFFAITAAQARHVAGFGAARSIDEHEVRRAMIS